MMFIDCYALFELSQDCASAQVTKAYRRAALKFHPDKNLGNSEATRKFQDIGRAYEMLSDEGKRARYDKAYELNKATAFSISCIQREIAYWQRWIHWHQTGYNSTTQTWAPRVKDNKYEENLCIYGSFDCGEDFEYKMELKLEKIDFMLMQVNGMQDQIDERLAPAIPEEKETGSKFGAQEFGEEAFGDGTFSDGAQSEQNEWRTSNPDYISDDESEEED